MNKKLRISLVPVLILMLILSVLPVFADTYGNYTYSVYNYQNPDNTYTKYAHISKYHGSESSVVIPDSLGGYPVYTIGSSAFANNTSLTSVVVPSSVKEISLSAFSDCTNLSGVTLSNGLLSIGGYAFYKCTSLKSIVVPNSVTSLGNDVFSYCENLTSITLPSSLTNIGSSIIHKTPYHNNEANWSNGLLYFNNYLLDSTGYKLSGAVNIKSGTTLIAAYALSSSKITSVSIPESVKHICASAFSYCESLGSVKLPSNLLTMGNNAFSHCESLSSISIPSTVTHIPEGAFSGCINLSSATLPSTITTIDTSAFRNCEKLSSVSLPSSLATIESSAFENTAISSVTIPANVSIIRSAAFAYCRNLSKITVDSKNTNFFASNNVLYKNDGNLVCYPAAKTDSSYTLLDTTTYIYANAISGNNYLKNVTLNDNISDYISSYAFDDAYALENINATSSSKYYKSINGVLFQGTVLKNYPQGKKDASYTIPGGITEIKSCSFSKNPYITSITFPEGVQKISSSAIDRCENIKSISLPLSAASISSSFVYVCPELSSVTYNGTVAQWEKFRIGFDSKSRDGLYIYCTDGTLEALPPQPLYPLGDSDLDGTVNIKDATAIQKYSALLITLGDTSLKVSDVNADNDINIKDATAIQKHIAGINTGYNIGK